MKRLFAILLAALPLTLGAQSPESLDKPAVARTTGAAFAISVKNLDATTKWYSEKLGLSVVSRVPKSPRTGFAVVGLAGGGLFVELVQNDTSTSTGKAPELTRGFFKVGMLVENYEETLAELRARHVDIVFGPFPGKPNAIGQFIIRDNEGNLIQLFGRHVVR